MLKFHSVITRTITSTRPFPWLPRYTTAADTSNVATNYLSYGLTPSQIKTFAFRRTRYLALGVEVLERVLVRVENLGIPRESPMFFHGILAMCTMTEADVELKMGVYRQYGFNDQDLLTLARKNPHAMVISEPRLRKCLEFFINVAGFRVSEIASAPHMLTLSYEKRISPRYDVWKCLKEKAIMKRSLLSCLILTDAKFFKKYVVPFKDEFPDLYRDYVKRVRPVTDGAK